MHSGPRPQTSATYTAKLGLGSTTFGREIDQAAAYRMLDHAFACGIRHIDTAVAYSAGASERMIGDWLQSNAGVRTSLTIATKLLPPYTAATIEATVADSRKRLGLEQIDVLYLHRWDATAENTEVRAALDGLVRQGAIGSLGISNCPQTQLKLTLQAQQAEGRARFAWLQNNQNFAVREAPLSYRSFCSGEGVSVVTFSPLGAGFLTGKHTGGVVPGSRFAVAPAHRDIYFNPTCQRRLEVLTATAREHGVSQTDLALAWALSRPLTDIVLVGGRDLSQIDQALAARSPVFDAAVAKLESLEPDL